ncbi:MAG: hypothetical protein HC833_10790 [Leptolyngbyaceae cyanobacterium RM1_406_9]|nr:hypothetical protein [Leptolyngbyaceae cyanobacterium RM1_406_9]
MVLGLALLDRAAVMDTVTSKTILEAVQRRAVQRWGDANWRAELARATVEILRQTTDPEATYENRRRQLYRVFEVWSCTLETAIALVAAVGCKFQMSCTKIEIEEF